MIEFPGHPLVFTSWFPGCAEPDVLRKLAVEAGAAGVELRYLHDDARRIAESPLSLSFHLPTLPGEEVAHNLLTGETLCLFADKGSDALALSDMPFLSYHLGFSCEKVQKIVGPDLACSPTLPREEVIGRIAATVKRLKDLSGKDILVENMDYGPTGALEYVCEPETIREICERAGCGALLDIAHAEVSAEPLGLSEEDYLGRMIGQLADIVREVHINAPRNGKDAHLSPTERELGWLRRLLAAGAQPEIVVLERDWSDREGAEFVDIIAPEARVLLDLCRDFPSGA